MEKEREIERLEHERIKVQNDYKNAKGKFDEAKSNLDALTRKLGEIDQELAKLRLEK